MKLVTAFRLAISLAAALPLAACSSAEEGVELGESDEAELTSTARGFVADYRWEEGRSYLHYSSLNLKNSRGSWGRYEAQADVGLTGSLIVCVRAPCTSGEEGSWKITKYAGKLTLKIRPDSGGERVYRIRRTSTGGIEISQGNEKGRFKVYENPCNLIDCQPGMTCRDDGGQGVCIPLDPCMTVRCSANTHCEANPDGSAGCVPNNVVGCEAMLCAPGTTCVEDANGQGECQTTTVGCAAMLCGPGTTCVEDANGQGECKANTACIRTGCSGQICAAQSRISTCEWRPQYACYQQAICELGSNGQCGFRQTNELSTCLANNQ